MIRICRSADYNWDFDTVTGRFQRWGRTQSDDPSYSPYGPEILDLEISTICHGGTNGPCNFCYKQNTKNGKYMPTEVFKNICAKMPSNLTQIAFGIGDLDGHPDLEKILALTRSEGIIPNITINGFRLTNKTLGILATHCGSIAVSRYSDDECFGTVSKLMELGAKQINIHQVISPDTIQDCLNLIDSVRLDRRLEYLNAVVFLMMKPKGRARGCSPVAIEDFKKIVDKALNLGIPFGFDSCSAPSFLKVTEDNDRFREFTKVIEPCEALLFSSYCNVDGEFFPCSFCEGEKDWETGLPINKDTDFLKDIWNHERVIRWRASLQANNDTCNCKVKPYCRSCPIFKQIVLCN